MLLVLPFLPETPRWLVAHGRENDAATVYARLNNTEESHAKVQHKMSEIIATHRFEKSIGEAGWFQVFKNDEGQSLRRMLLGAMPQFMQQMSGKPLIRSAKVHEDMVLLNLCRYQRSLILPSIAPSAISRALI